jgi:hypothetical protein
MVGGEAGKDKVRRVVMADQVGVVVGLQMAPIPTRMDPARGVQYIPIFLCSQTLVAWGGFPEAEQEEEEQQKHHFVFSRMSGMLRTEVTE